MSGINFVHTYNNIISVENLLEAWSEFVRGKRSRKDVQKFERNLMRNIIGLHQDIATKKYRHSQYEAFNISDPKPRNIHKAIICDRLLHRAIYRKLYLYFDRIFIHDSYSCRNNKGTHKAINRFRKFAYKVSRNHTQTVWVLKCDIKKFFASVGHCVLTGILEKHITDQDILWLLSQVIGSFHTTKRSVGLLLGNLISQLLVNIYMNEFDQFMKHILKTKYYIRYADDFVVFSKNKAELVEILSEMRKFLNSNLHLQLHKPGKKVSIQTVASGVDFLGWVHFPDHRVLRTATKKKMLRKIREEKGKVDTVQSYLGMLRHGNAYKIENQVKQIFFANEMQQSIKEKTGVLLELEVNILETPDDKIDKTHDISS